MKTIVKKVLSCFVVAGILITAVPCVFAAVNDSEIGDYIKILDKERRLEFVQATATAHLKNNVLDLYFTEQNSDLWQYQWEPGQWGESCYHEHFGVYTGNEGRTLESEDFTIDQPFTDPGGVSGTVTAILHYGDVQVKRKITLISGDIKFFEIEYTIKNIGSSTLNDVRFFQTIDFDIPWTSDCGDDMAEYDAENDYVIVKDDEYFENSFTGSIPSDRHGVDHWSTEIYDDWDDGNLNNVGSYGPGDPGIGLQYNLGNLAAGDDEIVTITVWSGEPAEPVEPKINSITFGDNKGNHHTDKYPSEYIVLRRGQRFNLNADIENFDDGNHKIIFKVTKPNGQTHEFTAIKNGILGAGWDCSYTRKWYNQNKFNFEIHIPGSEQVGKYQLTCEIQKKDGKTYDTTDTPEFYVIFNPWSSEDEDVKDMPDHEISFYISNDGYEYYTVLPKKWTLNPGDKEIFGTVMERVSGETSADMVAEKILDLIICNAGYDGHDQFDLEHTNEGYTLPSDYGDLQHIESFDTSEILPGYWSDIHPLTHKTSDGYKLATICNVPDIIHDWKDDEKQYGQCHYFAALGTSLLRSIGIPSRMITTIDGKMAQDPRVQWNFHCWAEIWNGRSLNVDKWKTVATTEQMGPSSRCAPVLKTMTESYYCPNILPGFPPTPQDLVQEVLTDKVAPWLLFWWHLEKDNIAESYTSCTTSTNYMMPRVNGTNSEKQLEINISTNKPEYALGEDILIKVNVTNNNDVQITENLTTVITGMASGGLMDYRFSDTKEITILPHSTITEDYVLKQEDYVINRYYTVFSYINETNGWANFIINSRLNLTITLPETVLINETFDVTLEAKNILGIPLTNIEIQAEFPYYADVAGAPTNFTIPTLAPGSTHLTTWFVSMPKDGYQSMVFRAQSVGGGYEQIATGTEVMSNPFLRVDVEVPSSVQKDTTFAVNVTIVNEGDLTAEDVQSTLNLPPGLTTPDDWIRDIGTIEPHANTTLVWNITANAAGTLSFTILTSSSTTSAEDVIFIPIFIYDHDLELSVEQSQLESDGELHCIDMAIHNLGDVEDSVLLQYLVTNPDISFSIYDGDERIIAQPVTVPASGNKILNLKIIPEPAVTGAITIHATSELDPTASDSTNIEVIRPSLIAETAIFRGGTWYVDTTGDRQWDDSFVFGTVPGDVPLVGDINQDGREDTAIFRSGTWYVDYDADHAWDDSFVFGTTPGDVPVVGDINQDGKHDTAIFRSGMWYVDYDADHAWDHSFSFGTTPGDVPVVGDINQDGREDTTIFRSGMWYVDYDADHAWDDSFSFGTTPGDVPVVGDINQDGKHDTAIFRSGMWYVDYDTDHAWDDSFSFGTVAGDVPVVGDINPSVGEPDEEPDIEVSKTVWDPKTEDWVEDIKATVNAEVRFKIMIHNSGTSGLTNILVNDTMSASLTYAAGNATVNDVPCEPEGISGQCIKWYYNAGSVCTNPFLNLPSGEDITIEFNATKDLTGDDTNCVNVSAWYNETGTHVQVVDDDCAGVYGLSDDTAIFRGGTWYVDTDGSYIRGTGGWDESFSFGASPGDVPVVGDINRDGTDDVAIFRYGMWYVDTTGDYLWDESFTFGATPGDVPLVGDIDQDGLDDVAIFRGGTWYVDTTGDYLWDESFTFGASPGDVPVVGDIDQDGLDDTAIFRSGMWYVDTDGGYITGTGGWDESFTFGASPGDVPVVGDIDQDGLDDTAIFRSGTWYVDTDGGYISGTGGWDESFTFGASPGDVPVVGDIK